MRINKILKNNLPIIGMIHLGGKNPINKAFEEIEIYNKHGVDGIIVENYFGSVPQVEAVLKELRERSKPLFIGVNILPNEYEHAFELVNKYHADFIQVDYVAGRYRGHSELSKDEFLDVKKKYQDITVLGGVWPKYYSPIGKSNLEVDLAKGKGLADAVVVTGSGTGEETPSDKIKRFRKYLGDYPLIVGAGLTDKNVVEQMSIADGAIVGTYFKYDGKTGNKVDPYRVKIFMDKVKKVREKR